MNIHIIKKSPMIHYQYTYMYVYMNIHICKYMNYDYNERRK